MTAPTPTLAEQIAYWQSELREPDLDWPAEECNHEAMLRAMVATLQQHERDDERLHQLDNECGRLMREIAALQEQYERALAVVEAARSYRQAEQDGTPRMWRGKELNDLATVLDDALAAYDAETTSAGDERGDD